VLALLAAVTVALIQSCAPTNPEDTSRTSGGDRTEGSDERTAPDGTDGANEETGGRSQDKEKDRREPEDAEQPFAAIPPPGGETDAARTPENGLDLARLEDIATGRVSAVRDQYGSADGETTAEEDPDVRRSVPRGRTLLSGVEDSSDGPLKEHRLVAYYGHPSTGLMGILGQYSPGEMMERLKEQTRAYSAADPGRPAVPTIELIASVAQRDPGPDGLYVAQTPPEEIQRYARLAEENDALLLLDVQLGRATIQQEIEILRPFLERPYVHLAIDTEYSVEEGQVPGVDLGTVDGSEIAEAVRYLDEMVEREDLPDKVLLIHQFQAGIVTNKQLIEPTDNVEVVLHADGFGAPEDKFEKYRALVREEPIQYGGFKVFYTQDAPVLNPEQVLALDPAPAVVTYQ
jgi:hypothetical protein